jgi:hypothetical protein
MQKNDKNALTETKKTRASLQYENLEQNTPKTPAPWQALPLKKSKS